MQDKEFDRIFNEKFEDFEVEPSAMVWNNIAGELDGRKAKLVMMPWLSIAATVLVALGAGIFFLQKGNSNTDQPKQNKLVANRVEPAKQITPVQPVEHVITKPAENVASTVNHQHNVIPAVNTPTLVDNTTRQVDNATEPVKDVSPQVIAAVPDPASTHVSTATVPDVTLTPKVLDATPQVERPVMATQSAMPKKRGIHNLGGLINALVAKVDKREDKIIEFSDSDDDDTGSDLTGVNLGLIKIKKQQ